MPLVKRSITDEMAEEAGLQLIHEQKRSPPGRYWGFILRLRPIGSAKVVYTTDKHAKARAFIEGYYAGRKT